ncbi:MAG: acyltransferase family protein [Pseudomonadota bacterium]
MSMTTERRYDIDALRVIAFGLLILYHCGMFYVADWDWHIKSRYLSVALQEPMRFTNQWRMSLLFVISGLAISFIWQRYSPGELARKRLWRLGLPLIFGMAVTVAPQPYYQALAAGIIEPGFFKFWGQYLTFHDFPGEAWGGENRVVWTWNHLWYLPYVLFYTLLLALIGTVLPRAVTGAQVAFQQLRGPAIMIAPLVLLMVYGNFVFPHFPYIDHGLTNDGYAHALYGTLFLLGFLIGRDPGIWNSICSWRWFWLGLGLVSYPLLRFQELWVGDEPTLVLEQLSFLNIYVNRLSWIFALLAFSYTLLNRPLPGLSYATAAVFPWYVLHQTITVTAGYELAQLELGPVLEPLLVVTLTLLGCAVLYECVIRRVPGLAVLFGGPVRSEPKPQAATLSTSRPDG